MRITITACAGLLLMVMGLLVFVAPFQVADAFTIPALIGLSALHGGMYVMLGPGAVAVGGQP